MITLLSHHWPLVVLVGVVVLCVVAFVGSVIKDELFGREERF